MIASYRKQVINIKETTTKKPVQPTADKTLPVKNQNPSVSLGPLPHTPTKSYNDLKPSASTKSGVSLIQKGGIKGASGKRNPMLSESGTGKEVDRQSYFSSDSPLPQLHIS